MPRRLATDTQLKYADLKKSTDRAHARVTDVDQRLTAVIQSTKETFGQVDDKFRAVVKRMDAATMVGTYQDIQSRQIKALDDELSIIRRDYRRRTWVLLGLFALNSFVTGILALVVTR